METKKPDVSLEARLTSLKDQFLAALNSTKLVVSPKIDNLTLTYEKRGNRREIIEGCKIIQLGLKAMLEHAYEGNVDIRFETVNEKRYSATLDLLAEQGKEQELAYNALTKINEFIKTYNRIKK